MGSINIENGLSTLLSRFSDHGISSQKLNAVSEFIQTDLGGYLQIIEKIAHNKQDDYSEFAAASYNLVNKGSELEQYIDSKLLIKKTKELFRQLVGDWAYQSIIVKRAYQKPRGYPGDYALLEMIYNNVPLTSKSNKIGYYFDKLFLSNGLAVAVRERKDRISKDLGSLINGSKDREINIINFASGSARELKALKTGASLINKKITISCVDFDEESLAFARKQLEADKGIDFVFLKKDIVKAIKERAFIKEGGGQQAVYSIG